MTLNTRRPARGRALRRPTVLATAVLVGATALYATPNAVAADRWGPGFSVPDDQNTPGASHLGAYGAPGAPVSGISGRAYCADPTLAGPSEGGQYGKATEVSTWTSKVTGQKVSKENTARAAYVLSKYGDTANDTLAGAVDAAVYSFLEQGTTYALPNGKRALERVSYPNVPKEVKTKAQGLITEAGKLAGPYKVNLHTPAALKPGEKATITLDVTAASGQKVPGVQISLNGAGAVAGAGTVTTNDEGVATASITPAKAGTVELKAVAKDLPASTLTAHLPANDKAQRMLLAGGTTTAEAQLKITVDALKGSIKLLKTASDTKKPLSGVQFEAKDEAGKTVAKGTTNTQGLWQIDDLPPGNYTIHEVQAVEGYQLAVDQNITVVDGKTSDVSVIDVKIPQPEKPKPRPVDITELPKTGA